MRARELDRLGDDILARNNSIFFSGVANQAFPINREIGGRWFDELGWPEELLDAIAVSRRSAIRGAGPASSSTVSDVNG